MQKLRLTLLGGLEITGSYQAGAHLMSRKAKALLAYLALQQGRTQSREKLAALLWHGSSEEKARTNLRQTLSSIRKALNCDDASLLVTESDQVSLNNENIRLDVVTFEQLVAAATPAALKKADALYRGDLLDGFSLKEDSFEVWVRAEPTDYPFRPPSDFAHVAGSQILSWAFTDSYSGRSARFLNSFRSALWS